MMYKTRPSPFLRTHQSKWTHEIFQMSVNCKCQPHQVWLMFTLVLWKVCPSETGCIEGPACVHDDPLVLWWVWSKCFWSCNQHGVQTGDGVVWQGPEPNHHGPYWTGIHNIRIQDKEYCENSRRVNEHNQKELCQGSEERWKGWFMYTGTPHQLSSLILMWIYMRKIWLSESLKVPPRIEILVRPMTGSTSRQFVRMDWL